MRGLPRTRTGSWSFIGFVKCSFPNVREQETRYKALKAFLWEAFQMFS